MIFMAFILNMDTDKTVSVVVSKDSSIVDFSQEKYDEYLKDLDESKLTFNGVPTRFVMKKSLPYKDTKRVMNSQVSFEDGQAKVNVSFMLDEVRCALVGIEGPGAESFKKDKDGYASMDMINALYNAGVLMDLYTARRNAAGEGEDSVSKKS
jgi:hypothetical protein